MMTAAGLPPSSPGPVGWLPLTEWCGPRWRRSSGAVYGCPVGHDWCWCLKDKQIFVRGWGGDREGSWGKWPVCQGGGRCEGGGDH